MKSNLFNEIINIIYQKSPFQKKKIQKHLAGQNEAFFGSTAKVTL